MQCIKYRFFKIPVTVHNLQMLKGKSAKKGDYSHSNNHNYQKQNSKEKKIWKRSARMCFDEKP